MSWEIPGQVAAAAPVSERVAFIRRTYGHLAFAIFSFVMLEMIMFGTGTAQLLVETIFSAGRFGPLLLLGGFIAVGWVAEKWAHSNKSVGMQYLGLGLYVFAEAIIFAPLLYVAAYLSGQPNVIAEAGVYTLLIFAGLTGTVFFTKADFSWMRGMLAVAGMAALGTVVCSMLFGFTLGTLFSGLMVLLAAGYILYYTSNILHHYPTNAHVAAALALFAAVALLFYYVLRFLMQSRR